MAIEAAPDTPGEWGAGPQLQLPAGSGKAVLNALTVDLEDWYQGLQLDRSEWGRFESRVEGAMDRLMRVLDASGARATFFVLGAVAEEHPGLVPRLVEAGHEIATHGYAHRLLYELDRERFREDLRRSIALLEEQSGRRVVGHRAPFFSITGRSLWALDVLVEEGVVYDSSIFPVPNWRYGIPEAPRRPFVHSTASGTITEFPLSAWSRLGRNVPAAGGAYFRIYPYALTRRLLASINAQGVPAAFYLHPWELDPDHPRIPLPRRIALTHYFNLRSTEGRLRRLLDDFSFAPMREVLGVD
jgi:polysaccharide deacetylase family protein (PEP-CTERM system associated)